MAVSKWFCDGEYKFLFETKEEYKVLYVKTFC